MKRLRLAVVVVDAAQVNDDLMTVAEAAYTPDELRKIQKRSK
jgi:hypothetical protein